MATHSSILAWENPMDREAWQTTVPRVTKDRTQLSNWEHAHAKIMRTQNSEGLKY